MNLPARNLLSQKPQTQAIPIREPAPPPPEETKRSVHYYAADLEAKLEDRERKLELANCSLATERAEKETAQRDNARLLIQVRELTAANNVYKIANSVNASNAIDQVQRVSDACHGAVNDIAEASRLLCNAASAKIKELNDVAETAMKRLFNTSAKAIEDANAHALRAGLNPDEPQPPHEQTADGLEDGIKAIAAKFGANNRPEYGDELDTRA